MIRRSGLSSMPFLVLAGCAQPPAKPSAAPLEAKLDAVMADALAKREMPAASLVVVKGNQVVYGKGFGKADLASGRPMTDTTPTVIGSTSKPLTALGILRLVQTGKVALDTPIARYLPDLKFTDPRGAAITVRQLLNNRSGIASGFSGPAHVLPSVQDDGAVDRIARESAGLPLVFAPGTSYLYSNRGWLIAGYLIQRVAGEPVEAFMKREVFEPLGMTQTTLEFWKVPDLVTGYESGFKVRNQPHTASLHRGYGPSGMTVSTPRDMGRLLVAMLNGGKTVSGTQFLTPELIAEATRAQAEAESELGGPTRYGLGWEVDSVFGALTVKKAGSVGTMVSLWIMLPEQKVGIALTFNREDYGIVPVAPNILKVIAGGAVDTLPTAVWTAPPSPVGVKLSAAAAHRWVGDYDLRFGDTKVYQRADSLRTDYEGGEAALVPVNDSTFAIVDDLTRHAGKQFIFRMRGGKATIWESAKDSLGIRVR